MALLLDDTSVADHVNAVPAVRRRAWIHASWGRQPTGGTSEIVLAVLLFSAAASRRNRPAEWETDWKTAFQTAAEQAQGRPGRLAATWCKPSAS